MAVFLLCNGSTLETYLFPLGKSTGSCAPEKFRSRCEILVFSGLIVTALYAITTGEGASYYITTACRQGDKTMALIAPFRALRYNSAKIQHLEEVVTPPYDVIDLQAQAAFAGKNPYNMIHLDLSKNFSAEQLTKARYRQARETFVKWQEEGVLIRDKVPTIYLYHTEYSLPS